MIDLLRPDRSRVGCRGTGRAAARDHCLVGDRSGGGSNIYGYGDVGIDVVGRKRVRTSAGERTEGAGPSGAFDISGSEAGWHGVGYGDGTGSWASTGVHDLNEIFIADLARWEVADVKESNGQRWRWGRWSGIGAASAANQNQRGASDERQRQAEFCSYGAHFLPFRGASLPKGARSRQPTE